jgi:hypothetical protein
MILVVCKLREVRCLQVRAYVKDFLVDPAEFRDSIRKIAGLTAAKACIRLKAIKRPTRVESLGVTVMRTIVPAMLMMVKPIIANRV